MEKFNAVDAATKIVDLAKECLSCTPYLARRVPNHLAFGEFDITIAPIRQWPSFTEPCGGYLIVRFPGVIGCHCFVDIPRGAKWTPGLLSPLIANAVYELQEYYTLEKLQEIAEC